jgi:cytochrome c/anaphase-promoting complex subunit 4
MAKALLSLVLSVSVASLAGAAEPTYEQLAPLLEAKCTLCHDSEDQGGGLDLSTYDAILRGGASGDVVKPGDANGSKLYRVVARLEQPFMPRGDGPLSEGELKLLERWIASGLRRDAKSKPLKSAARPGVALELPQARGEAPLPLALPLDAIPSEHRADAAIALDTSPGAPFLVLGARDQLLSYAFPEVVKGKQSWGPRPFLGALAFPGRVHELRFSRQGAHLLALGGDAAREGRASLYDVRTGRVLVNYAASKDVFLAGDLREDLAQFALGGPDRKVRLVSCRGEPEQVLEGHTDWITAISYSPDGVLLATADRAGGVFLWESRGAQRYLRLPAHPARVSALAWRPDSNLLVTGCEDGWIRAFEPYEGKEVKKLRAHPAGVLDASFARDGKLVTSGRDRRLKLWGVAGQLLAQSRPLPDLPLQARFRSEPNLIVTGDWQGDLRLWEIKPRPKPKGKQPKAKQAKGKKPKAKPLPLLLAPRGRLHATPPTLEERLVRARRATVAAVPSGVAAEARIARGHARAQVLAQRARWVASSHRQTLAQVQPTPALEAQRLLVTRLVLALEAARVAEGVLTTKPGDPKRALRAGSPKDGQASSVQVLSRLLGEARVELNRRQSVWLRRARPALVRARLQRRVLRKLARARLANARRVRRLSRGPERGRLLRAQRALEFWRAEERYQELWRAAKRARQVSAKASREAEALAPQLSALGGRARALASRVAQSRVATSQAAARLRYARPLSTETAALAESLIKVAQRLGSQRPLQRRKQVLDYLDMARETLASARTARSQRDQARRALFRPAWVSASLGARRAAQEALRETRQALAAKFAAQRAAATSAQRDASLAKLAAVRAEARRQR